MTTTEIITEFITLIDNDKEYTIKELKQIITDVYKTKNGVKKQRVVKSKKTDKDEEVIDCDNEKIVKKSKKTAKSDKKDKADKPKRLPTSYNNYMKIKGAEIKANDPSVKSTEIMGLIAIQWKLLSQDEKDSYKTNTKVVTTDEEMEN